MSTLVHHPGNVMHSDALMFDATLPGFLSFTGVPMLDVEFIGYLLLGPSSQPIIYPLYCSRDSLDNLKAQLSLFAYLLALMVHASPYEMLPSIEVPVFILALHENPMLFLNLPWVKGKTGSDNMLHGVYNHVGVARAHKPPTTIHLAQFPSGYHHTDESVDGSGSILQTTWVDSSAMTSAAGICSGRQVRPKKIKAEHSLHKIMALNGFYAFLIHQAAKEMIFHIVFRTTATNRICLTIADLEPAIFRNTANPPADTLALMGSCCYQSLLTWLVSIWGTSDIMPQYPPATQVHTKLL
ncbi:hypothetical protein EDB19DRAFT_1828695 [Suillus lakei]|nr:hypothetical protein EDB19DRAFT_1828695 [Suillus lakei]